MTRVNKKHLPSIDARAFEYVRISLLELVAKSGHGEKSQRGACDAARVKHPSSADVLGRACEIFMGIVRQLPVPDAVAIEDVHEELEATRGLLAKAHEQIRRMNGEQPLPMDMETAEAHT